jgi:hypothetical protein
MTLDPEPLFQRLIEDLPNDLHTLENLAAIGEQVIGDLIESLEEQAAMDSGQPE